MTILKWTIPWCLASLQHYATVTSIQLQNISSPQKENVPTGGHSPSPPSHLPAYSGHFLRVEPFMFPFSTAPSASDALPCKDWEPHPLGGSQPPRRALRSSPSEPPATRTVTHGNAHQTRPVGEGSGSTRGAPEVPAGPPTRKRSGAATASAEGGAARALPGAGAGRWVPWSSSARRCGCGAASLTATGGSGRCCSTRG